MGGEIERGILLRRDDVVIRTRAGAAGLPVVVRDDRAMPFAATLIVEAGTRVPFDLLPAAWHLLAHWDVLVPLWREWVLAEHECPPAARRNLKEELGDLRVPLYSYELLFVRRGPDSAKLLAEWEAAIKDGYGERVGFTAAIHRAKPRLCALPTTWLAEVRQWDRVPVRGRGTPMPLAKPLVRVEISPGRFVQVRKGDEERAKEAFRKNQQGRARR